MTHTEENAMIARAIAEFPNEFGLRAFPGKRFRINHGNSYYSNGVMLYTDVLGDDGKWLAFAKGSPEELHREVVKLLRRCGDIVKFSAQPYHSGTGKIVEIAKNHDAIGGWDVTIEVIEGTTTNRMFQYTSNTPMKPGERLPLRRVYDLSAEVLIYVYPV
jgi:hypothetical protein